MSCQYYQLLLAPFERFDYRITDFARAIASLSAYHATQYLPPIHTLDDNHLPDIMRRPFLRSHATGFFEGCQHQLRHATSGSQSLNTSYHICDDGPAPPRRRQDYGAPRTQTSRFRALERAATAFRSTPPCAQQYRAPPRSQRRDTTILSLLLRRLIAGLRAAAHNAARLPFTLLQQRTIDICCSVARHTYLFSRRRCRAARSSAT